jgi:hypothetical protein
MQAYENKVLKRIFGTKREEVAEDWRRLLNEELHNLYASTHVLLSLAPQPSLGLGLFHKIRLNFLEASQQFVYRVGLLAPRQTLG